MSVFAEALGRLRIDEAAFLRLVESASRASLEEAQGFTSALFVAVEHQIGRPLAQTERRAFARVSYIVTRALSRDEDLTATYSKDELRRASEWLARLAEEVQ